MDFIDRLLDHLETTLKLFSGFTVDFLPNGQAITIRRTPSAPTVRFLDGGIDLVTSFQILVKHENQVTAINTLDSIIKALEGLQTGEIKSNNDSFEFIKCELYTTPTMVEKDEGGFFVYTAIFNTTLFIK